MNSINYFLEDMYLLLRNYYYEFYFNYLYHYKLISLV